MKYTLDWLTDPEVFAVNRIAAHSDHRIYANHLEADADNSSLIQNLNGTWKFVWAKNPSEWQQKFYEESDSTDNFDNIQVPGHMELQGYGKPQYVNTIYPWEGQEHLRPPFISEKDNSVGSYVRYFDLNDALKNKRVFISFQGVETAMYVWLNGEFIGYSEDSFTPSEFELTPYIREKDNKLAVAVFKRSSASWLEDQDFWRFSGIFRDVFLYAAPSAHVRDMRVIADYDGTNGIFSATLDIVGKCSVKSILTDENGTVIAQSNEKESVNWTIENSKPWSAEIPNLYTFTVILTDEDGNEIEVSRTKVGFRRFELKNGIMCLNGKRIIFKGINRHEFDAKTGRAITKEDMLFDIQFMKKNNINAVRTCHYPNNSLWYQLCDAYGIYLIDETNLETHGTWQKLGATDPSWNVPGSLPEWKEAVLDRAKSMYERDKNQASVLIWSCGNESYCGEDIAAMSEYFRSVDPTRLVHYEGVTRVPNHQYDSITDMESRMYAKPQEVEEYLKQNNGRPYISCEYMHAMGNSLGGLSVYTDLEDKYEAYQGGFIWDFVDQSVLVRRDGKTFYGYTGDWNNYDSKFDQNFCNNGLIAPDRTWNPHAYEVQRVYQSVWVTPVEGRAGQEVEVYNEYAFRNLDNYYLEATVLVDGRPVAKGQTDLTGVAPGERKRFQLPVVVPAQAGNAEVLVNVAVRLKESEPLLDAGFAVAKNQWALQDWQFDNAYAPETAPAYPLEALSVKDDGGVLQITGESCSWSFDREDGFLTGYRVNGREQLAEGGRLTPNFWRAPTDNDMGANLQKKLAVWRNPGYHLLDMNVLPQPDGTVQLTTTYRLEQVDARLTLTYTFYKDGVMKVHQALEAAGKEGPMLPRFGMQMQVPATMEYITYYGRGPVENYADRKEAADLGIYHQTVTEQFYPYIRPQETGNKCDVRWWKLTEKGGRGLELRGAAPLSVSALHYSIAQLDDGDNKDNRHSELITPSPYTNWCIDKVQMGLGCVNTWGALPLPKYLLPLGDYEYTFLIYPIR